VTDEEIGDTSNLYVQQLPSHAHRKPACLALVYLWVTVRLRLPGTYSSSSRAAAVDTVTPSILDSNLGLSGEAAWGLSKWGGPAGQGVLTSFAARFLLQPVFPIP
jgi:hypothetical protein